MEDIFYLLEKEEININSKLKAALLGKRRVMRQFWENALPNRVSGCEEAGWYN
jgi:hypothetical protein